MKQDEETEIMKKESQKQREQRISYQEAMGMRGMHYDRFYHEDLEREKALIKIRGAQ